MHEINNLRLTRYPFSEQGLLPWNAADKYLYNLFRERYQDKKNILIVNDCFGFLSLSLSQLKPFVLTDSYISKKALETNADLNNIEIKNFNIEPVRPGKKLPEDQFDIVLLSIPKSITFFQLILEYIKPALRKDARVLAAGMTKHISPNIKELLESTIGETTTEKVIRKAVVFNSISNSNNIPAQSFEPKLLELKELNIKLHLYPNVFSNEKLDGGTRLLINNMPDLGKGKIIDLGCGSGIIGLTAKLRNPEIEVALVDESYLAVESTKLSFILNEIEGKYFVNDGLEGFPESSYDFVLSNPPFHSGTSMCQEAATRHFRSVHNCLITGGRFIVVCNRSLNYKPHLQKLYSDVKLLAEDKKYYLFEAIK